VKYNLEKEIENGTGEKFFYQLFGNETPGYPEFISNGPKYMVERGFRANRNNGILFYNILKLNYPSIFNKNIDESVLSYAGMTLLGEGKVEDAVYIFEKNRSEFPESPGVFYDLGYGYENNGNQGSAIEAYKQALYLDPGFEDAINALARLEKNR
jgi:tetratricopeptide (TPR) repeat protein